MEEYGISGPTCGMMFSWTGPLNERGDSCGNPKGLNSEACDQPEFFSWLFARNLCSVKLQRWNLWRCRIDGCFHGLHFTG